MFPNTPGLFRGGNDDNNNNSGEGNNNNARPVFTPFQSMINNSDDGNNNNNSMMMGSMTSGFNESMTPGTIGNNNNNTRLDDLYAYGLDASALRLAPQMINVSVRCSWDDHVLQLRNIEVDTKVIRDMKEAVAANLRHETGQNWTANDLQFVYEGRMLNDEWLVADCDITNDAILHVSTSSNIAPIDNSSVYTVPTPGVANYDGNAIHANVGEEMIHEFNLENPHGYERMRAEELLEFNLRPQQRYFQNLLVNFDTIKDEAQFKTTSSPLSDMGDDDDAHSEEEDFLLVQQLVSQYHDVCHELKARHFNEDPTGGNKERKEWIGSEEEIWLYLMKLSELCYDEYVYEKNAATVNSQTNGVTYDQTSQIAIRRLLDFKLTRNVEEMNRCRKFRRINMIVQWFEQVAVDDVDYLQADLDAMDGNGQEAKAPWPDTIYEAIEAKRNSNNTSHFASELDPDGPTRSKMDICPDDELRQKILLHGVWTLLRAGRIDAAQRLCESQGEAWRAASLAGGQEDLEYPKDDDDEETHGVLSKYIPEGNAFRSLWKLTCWKLSEGNKTKKTIDNNNNNNSNNDSDNKSHLSSSFEQVIYAALAGNLNALLNSVHCNTWKDQFWAYVVCMKERMRDEALHNSKSLLLQTTKYVKGSGNVNYEKKILDKSTNVKSYLESANPADAIFNKLQQSEIANVRNDTGKVSTIIQGRLIANDFKDIIENRILKFVDESVGKSSTYRPDVLRFGTHLILWLRAIQAISSLKDRVMPPGTDPSLTSENRILCAYIDYLIERRQTSSIALYVSHLGPELGTARYGKFLEIVVDESERHVCVDLGKRHFTGAPEVLFNSLVCCVEATRTRYDEIIPGMRNRLESVLKAALGLNPHEISLQQFSRAWSLRWLCFYDEHRLEAVHQANMLCRDLLMEQKRKDDEISLIMGLMLLPYKQQTQVGGTSRNTNHQYLPIIPLDSEQVIQATMEESEWKSAIEEYRIYSEYTITQKKYLEWRESLNSHENLVQPTAPVYRRDLGPTENEGAEIQYEEDMRYYQEKMKEFSYQILRKCELVRNRIKNLMLKVVESMDNYLQRMLLPRLANQLHSVDYDTAQWISSNVLPIKTLQKEFHSKSIDCLKESLHVAEILADTKTNYLQVFNNLNDDNNVGENEGPNELDFLLQRIRHSAVALFDIEKDFVI